MGLVDPLSPLEVPVTLGVLQLLQYLDVPLPWTK